MQRVTLIAGDGIGPEVTSAARAVVETSGARVEFEPVRAGQEAEKATGTPLPPEVFESISRTKIAMKGPTYTPFGGNYRVRVERPNADGKMEQRSYPSLAITLRKELGLFVNLRPIKNYPNVPSRYDNVDLVIFRENSEDLYIGDERMVDADTAEGIKRITRAASERVARFAFDYMRKVGRKKITVAHKANVMKMTDGLWLKSTMFEAVHGTAPDIAGKDIANPTAMILSAVLMLRYMGETQAADRIEAALTAVRAEKRTVTRDLGGSAGTRAFAQAIVEKLRKLESRKKGRQGRGKDAKKTTLFDGRCEDVRGTCWSGGVAIVEKLRKF